MHEMSIAVALLDQLEDLAREHGFARVDSVTVRAGELRGIVPEAMDVAFREAAVGGVAEGARLELEFVPAAAHCRACGHRFAPEVDFYRCDRCGQADVDLVAGMDILLTSIEARGAGEEA